jgi:hypothetical protein
LIARPEDAQIGPTRLDFDRMPGGPPPEGGAVGRQRTPNAHHAPTGVHKQNVYRESHETRVNRVAWREQKSLALGKAGPAEQSPHPPQNTLGRNQTWDDDTAAMDQSVNLHDRVNALPPAARPQMAHAT